MCHGGTGWLEYDRAARQQRAINPLRPWNVIDPGLHSAFILSRSAATAVRRCSSCQGSITLPASVHWHPLSLLPSSRGQSHAAVVLFAFLGIGKRAASRGPVAIATSALSVSAVTGPESVQPQRVPPPHHKAEEINRPHPSIDVALDCSMYSALRLH